MRALAHQEFLIPAKRSIISNGTSWIVRRDANHT
jgi:hypothetical protein